MLDAIGAYIDTNTALTVATDLYKSFLPDSPDACVAIYENQGQPPRHGFGANTQFKTERPRVQVICRNAKGEYDLARAQAETIFLLLEKLTGTSLSSVHYIRIEALHSPFSLGPDSKGRPLVSFSVQVEKEIG